MSYQIRRAGGKEWKDLAVECADGSIMGVAGYEYRLKPEPAAPKWPQTTMTYHEMEEAYLIAGNSCSWHSRAAEFLANAAIAKECSTGALVPADKVREIEAKARAEGKREGLHPVAVIQAACNHMRLGDIDAETIQIILLKAAEL